MLLFLWVQRLPQALMTFAFWTFGFISPKEFKIIWLPQIFGFECTWWMLIKKRVVSIKCDFYVFIFSQIFKPYIVSI